MNKKPLSKALPELRAIAKLNNLRLNGLNVLLAYRYSRAYISPKISAEIGAMVEISNSSLSCQVTRQSILN